MPKTKYTKEILEVAVKDSISVAEVIRKLGLKQGGGTQQFINNKIKIWNIDISHFKGQSYLLGCSHDWKTRSDEELFATGTQFHSTLYRKRLIKSGVEYKCVICGLVDWQNNPLTLHIDHINGDRTDNRKQNLRFLCPNCHQQTETWGSNNRVGASSTQE